ncbi:MAG: cation-transporting P-type ATPase [Actinomycetota bacterium]|nr:cation-transporting P-type ATPase [Actinomycetota bacterium]
MSSKGSSPTLARSGGLTSVEARALLERDGPNRVIPEARSRRLKRLLGPLADPMVALLLIAAPTYLALGETTDAIVALAALVPIAGVGWLLESRAERTLEQLRKMTAPTARALRNGVEQAVPTEELVVGDAVWLQEGDVVPADGQVVELTQLLVDEATLTGESLPVAKDPAAADPHERGVWAGTTVLSGRALVEITVTGAATRYGRIGALVAAVKQPPTPLQRGLATLVRSLAAVAVVFCAAAMAAELLHGDGWGHAVIAGVSLAIAAIPEEFSMVYTLYLALGAWRLAQHKALVRRLPSVETLGSTTVICTDKTGTLTHGRMDVAAVWTPSGGRPGAHEVASEPVGGDERALLEAAVLACEPDPFDPLDVAIVHYASEHGIDVAALHRAQLVTDWPFEQADKYLTHVWRMADGTCRVAAKGSLEGLLRHVADVDGHHASATAGNAGFAADGMRVIAVAGRDAGQPAVERATDEAGLQLLGLVAFSDPIRDGVAEALAECRAAGVRVIMVTGDHPATAHAVAEGLDLPHEADGADLIATGDDLDGADAAQLAHLVAHANVFARTRPEQKHLLVGALRAQGEVVAMTGDGINDAPALREADIGVAMGERGTTVAREAASLVLMDDNFATIVGAVRDGRRIFDNLTRAFAYLIAFHPPLLFGALVMPLLGEPLWLLPVHLVVLELLLHPVVSLVFQADPADDDVMRRPPRPVGDALRLRAMWRPYAVGGVLAVAIIAEYLVALAADWPVGQARALAFCTLLASQPFLLLCMRSPDRPLWRSGRPFTRTLWWVLALIVVVTIGVAQVGPVARLLQFQSFPLWGWAVVVGVAAAATLWAEPLKRGARPPARAKGLLSA